MLVHACQSTITRPLGRRCIVRAESHTEGAVDDPREAAAKVPALIKGRRSHGGRLKKSKRMQALAASLASKTREGQSTEAASTQLTEHIEKSIDNRGQQLTEAAKKSEPAVHIPYDPTTPSGHFENDPEDHCVLPKPIYIVSDCTGAAIAPLRDYENGYHQCVVNERTSV